MIYHFERFNGENKLIRILCFFELKVFLISTVSSNLLEWDYTRFRCFLEVNKVYTARLTVDAYACIINPNFTG